MKKLILILMLICPISKADQYYSSSEINCVARAIYHEARGSKSLHAKIGVAQVVQNRGLSGSYPSNLCSVIRDRGEFPWYNKVPKPKEAELIEYKSLARVALVTKDMVNDATHFHTGRKPYWARNEKILARHGEFKFYKPKN